MSVSILIIIPILFQLAIRPTYSEFLRRCLSDEVISLLVHPFKCFNTVVGDRKGIRPVQNLTSTIPKGPSLRKLVLICSGGKMKPVKLVPDILRHSGSDASNFAIDRRY